MPETKKAETKKANAKKTAETSPRIQIPTQVLDFQRRALHGQQTLFDTTYNALTAVQDNQDRVWGSALEQASFVPAQVRELAEAWSAIRRQARESYKETVDKSFSLVEEWIDGLSSSKA